MASIPFWKYHGAGNDFVLVDYSRTPPPPNPSALALHLCHRQRGIGADGLLLLLPSSSAHFRMRIFNADGSEASMCGNGIRCLAAHLLKHSPQLLELSIETLHGCLKCRRFEDQIAVNLGPPSILYWPVEVEGTHFFVLNTGVPHAVTLVDTLDDIPVNALGKQIRFHPQFSPDGVNVNFASLSNGKLSVRTYERGLEAETLACGTGAAAAAFVAAKTKNLASPIPVLTRRCFDTISYAEHMRFLITDEIEMIGSIAEVFTGVYENLCQ